MELEELIRSIDIVEFISQYIELTQKGEEWWGLSCFKEEKTPSFSVRKNPPLFYDYSSGIGGNVYSFIKAYHNCSSREAVEIIKKYAGYDGEVNTRREKLSATIVCKQFMKPRNTKPPPSPTILPDDYMDRFEIRDDKLDVWRNEGISDSSLRKFQVMYDSFSNRLVYPIRNLQGKIVNVGGRTLDSDWKEKKLRKYSYFQGWGGGMDVVYGLYENLEFIKSLDRIIIFEGCKSVLIADTFGIHNTGALLTSHLSPYQMKILASLGCRVTFALDKEIDIRQDKNIQKLKQYVNVDYLCDKDNLLGEKDSPVDKGKEVFKRLYEYKKLLV